MLNNIVLIGRLVTTPALKNYDDGIKVSDITLAVTRPFKNSAGEFETDFIPISLWYGTAQNACQYTKKGDLVCIKGRLSQKAQEINGVNYHSVDVIGERIIFLSRSSKKEEIIEKIEEE